MQRRDFYFDLPKSLIANYPSKERTQCRMLCLDGESGTYSDHAFIELQDFLHPGDLLVFNDTKVIAARLYGKKETGGAAELLIERILGPRQALSHIKASKAPKAGMKICLDGGFVITVTGRQGDLFMVENDPGNPAILEILDKIGHIPLPPYIQRDDEPLDKERYQTVYSKIPGAVAAPTAGLHFDEAQLAALKEYGVRFAYVTLHVGAGTFQPVREDDILKHHMHQEFVHLPKETAEAVIATHKAGGRVIAVGTTAVRSLESAAAFAKEQGLKDEICPFDKDTGIFIYPGYRYRIVDALITNFHLPESTLIMLVCAFCGYQNTLRAYNHAVQQGYKFFSYGDCMFITARRTIDDLPPSYEE